MRTASGTGLILVRFETGEDIAAGLLVAFDQWGTEAASVTGMVGSLQRIKYSTAVCDQHGRPGRLRDGTSASRAQHCVKRRSAGSAGPATRTSYGLVSAEHWEIDLGESCRPV